MSKSLLRSKIPPKLFHRFTLNNNRVVEIWTTTCIVSNFGKQATFPDSTTNNNYNEWIVVNPCNSGLTGCKNFTYFPKGGPIPKPIITMHKDWQPLGYVSKWGGMEVGNGMLYPISVIDGIIHQMGGIKLQTEIKYIQLRQRMKNYTKNQTGDIIVCPIGTAIQTSAGSEPLSLHYDSIIHTTPPFYKYDIEPDTYLIKCYESVLDMISSNNNTNTNTNNNIRVSFPLLGSGARGFPYDIASTIAAQSISKWLKGKNDKNNNNNMNTTHNNNNILIAFGLLEESIAEQLANKINILI